jgi:hypothetical protein
MVFRSSADSGHSWARPLRALGEVRGLLLSLVGERFEPLSKLQRKLLRSPLGFQNCAKAAKYEALEKNVVSNGKLPSFRQSLVRSFSYKVSVCWGFWGRPTEFDGRLPRSMAEGEELGSSLLQVLHRRPTELGGLGNVAGAPRAVSNTGASPGSCANATASRLTLGTSRKISPPASKADRTTSAVARCSDLL